MTRSDSPARVYFALGPMSTVWSRYQKDTVAKQIDKAV